MEARFNRMRCVGGPFAGQTLDVPFGQLKIHWRPPPGSAWEPWPMAELVWIIHGPDRHCYQPVANGWDGSWRLIYRDTF